VVRASRATEQRCALLIAGWLSPLRLIIEPLPRPGSVRELGTVAASSTPARSRASAVVVNRDTANLAAADSGSRNPASVNVRQRTMGAPKANWRLISVRLLHETAHGRPESVREPGGALVTERLPVYYKRRIAIGICASCCGAECLRCYRILD
jgi:hypothetical protein